MRRVLLLMLVGTAGFGATTAFGQSATDQYNSPTVIGAGTGTTPATTGTTEATTPATTTTTPDEGVKSENSGGNGSGNGNGSGSGSNSGTNGTGVSATATASSGPPANRVAVLDFGVPSKALKRDLRNAIAAAGLQVYPEGTLTVGRLKTFLGSSTLRLLSPRGLASSGQAFGAGLVSPTALSRQAFGQLTPSGTPFVPAVRLVITRRIHLSRAQVKFLSGVTAGLKATGIPLAYAERSDVKTSLVRRFRKLHVLTVGDVDTPTGKRRLAGILLGKITTQKAVNAVKLSPASAVIPAKDGSSGPAPWALLAVVVGGLAFVMTGPLRHRGRRRPFA